MILLIHDFDHQINRVTDVVFCVFNLSLSQGARQPIRTSLSVLARRTLSKVFSSSLKEIVEDSPTKPELRLYQNILGKRHRRDKDIEILLSVVQNQSYQGRT